MSHPPRMTQKTQTNLQEACKKNEGNILLKYQQGYESHKADNNKLFLSTKASVDLSSKKLAGTTLKIRR